MRPRVERNIRTYKHNNNIIIPARVVILYIIIYISIYQVYVCIIYLHGPLQRVVCRLAALHLLCCCCSQWCIGASLLFLIDLSSPHRFPAPLFAVHPIRRHRLVVWRGRIVFVRNIHTVYIFFSSRADRFAANRPRIASPRSLYLSTAAAPNLRPTDSRISLPVRGRYLKKNFFRFRATNLYNIATGRRRGHRSF